MANALYPSILQTVLDGDLRWGTPYAFAKAILIASGAFAYNASHVFLSAVPPAAIVGYPLAFTGRVAVVRAAHANGLMWYGVSGPEIGAVVLYNDSGVAAAQTPLIAYLDDVGGLPVTPTGRDLALTWPTPTVFEI